jgi:hypothetical protein
MVGHIGGEGRRRDRGERLLTEDVPEGLGEASETDDRNGAQGRGLGSVGCGQEDLADSQPLSEVGD